MLGPIGSRCYFLPPRPSPAVPILGGRIPLSSFATLILSSFPMEPRTLPPQPPARVLGLSESIVFFWFFFHLLDTALYGGLRDAHSSTILYRNSRGFFVFLIPTLPGSCICEHPWFYLRSYRDHRPHVRFVNWLSAGRCSVFFPSLDSFPVLFLDFSWAPSPPFLRDVLVIFRFNRSTITPTFFGPLCFFPFLLFPTTPLGPPLSLAPVD